MTWLVSKAEKVEIDIDQLDCVALIMSLGGMKV
jgi:hypothetical protein